MASNVMGIAALGRPFTIGMLYDARKDELIPGLTLWDENTLQHKTVESSQHSSAFKISASDTIESKSSLLDVEASLKASFMSGLVQVGGSAKYLNNTKEFKNQSRVTFLYKATTHFKQLMIEQITMDKQQKDITDTGLATHVVTGILYGADAFFVFDSKKLEASNVQDIHGKMEGVIKKIPSFDLEGKVHIKLTDEEKALTRNLSCKFFGDLLLESNPATFEEAVMTYVELPKLLGEKRDKSVPVKVWLMPLKSLDPKAAELKSEISVGLVRRAEVALEDLREIDMRCNDSLDDKAMDDFPQIHKDLSNFQRLCNLYTAKLKQIMAEDIPLIREGKKDASHLEKVFKDKDKSPFSHENLSKWLDHKEREINVIRSCVEIMKGAKVVPNQSELDREVLAAGVEDALCFVFTSLEKDDPCLDTMTHFLDLFSVVSVAKEPWYYSDEVLTKMREKAKAVDDLVKVYKSSSAFRFLIAAIANEKYTGATIYHYRDGILKTDDFSRPQLPPVAKITDRRDLMWYACFLTLDPNTANNRLTLSEENKKATYGEPQKYPDCPERFSRHPQVLCREKLTGRHYWEVEWSDGPHESVSVGVAYDGIDRKVGGSKSELGCNKLSWCLNQSSSSANHVLTANHNGKVWSEHSPSTGCSGVGVLLDWPGGTLSFYRYCDNTLSHLYTFTSPFTEPVYPAFSAAKKGNYVYLNVAEREQ